MLWGGMANWRSKAILRWRKARVDLRRRECILAIYIVRILKTVVLASKKNLLGNANLLEVLTRAGLSSSPGQPLRNRWAAGPAAVRFMAPTHVKSLRCSFPTKGGGGL